MKHNFINPPTHLFLQIQVHFCPVGTCQIHLPNATAHKPLERGGRAAEDTWVIEGLRSWNKCSPSSEGLWHKGQWCFPRMRTVRIKKDLSLLHHFPLSSHHCWISTDLNNNQLHWVQLRSQSNHLSSSNCPEAPSWHENCFLFIPVKRKLYYVFSCANKSTIGQHRVNHRLLLPRICVCIYVKYSQSNSAQGELDSYFPIVPLENKKLKYQSSFIFSHV